MPSLSITWKSKRYSPPSGCSDYRDIVGFRPVEDLQGHFTGCLAVFYSRENLAADGAVTDHKFPGGIYGNGTVFIDGLRYFLCRVKSAINRLVIWGDKQKSIVRQFAHSFLGLFKAEFCPELNLQSQIVLFD